jgi:hypothetical protein
MFTNKLRYVQLAAYVYSAGVPLVLVDAALGGS